ncbi:hypothetical protein, partial [Borrelia sp. A-FGy1]|uniref:hypothetical protein n=1 Tax=Borrelia sp. A-FGy1 TaxID=2608247 RepID=UPI0015F4D9F7
MRSNMFILLLVALLFVSCKFFGNSSSPKKTAPSLDDAASRDSKLGRIPLTASSKKDENTSDSSGKVDTTQEDKQKSSPTMLAADNPTTDPTTTSSASTDKQDTKGKLSEEDKKKLMYFFRKTIRYQYNLVSIYNKYASPYNAIATYGDCNNYGIECFSPGPSAKRSKALTDLESLNLSQDYTKLSKMLKDALPNYDTKTLDEAIAEYKKAIDEASEAERKIEIAKNYVETQEAEEDKKNRNIVYLKTVRSILDVIESTMETASLAYADAFTVVSDSLSCSEF